MIALDWAHVGYVVLGVNLGMWIAILGLAILRGSKR